jgi:hypothetical protein
VSRWLSCSDFFSRQAQIAQFAAHHAGTGRHAFDLGYTGTQFGQSHVGLALNFGAQERRTVAEGTAWSVPLRQRCAGARLTPTPPPFLDGGKVNAEGFGNFALVLLTGFDRGDDTPTGLENKVAWLPV